MPTKKDDPKRQKQPFFVWKKIVVRLVHLAITLFVSGSLFVKNTGKQRPSRIHINHAQTLDPNPKHKFFLGLTNSEFNSIYFGVEIKRKKFMSAKIFLGLK